MRYLTMTALVCACAAGPAALAQDDTERGGTGQGGAGADSPVVVELFTSQGCSSCPPADALLAELGTRDDVIPLALHVDYWDYIGWKDSFADPAFTRRQKSYAKRANRHAIYTPQMIINGQHDVVGNRPMDVVTLIERHKDSRAPVTLNVSRAGDMLAIVATAGDPVGPVDIHVVSYLPHASVDVPRGENAGRTLDYTHVVDDWRTVASWGGAGRFETEVAVPGGEPVVVLAQKADQGPVLAAARLR